MDIFEGIKYNEAAERILKSGYTGLEGWEEFLKYHPSLLNTPLGRKTAEDIRIKYFTDWTSHIRLRDIILFEAFQETREDPGKHDTEELKMEMKSRYPHFFDLTDKPFEVRKVVEATLNDLEDPQSGWMKTSLKKLLEANLGITGNMRASPSAVSHGILSLISDYLEGAEDKRSSILGLFKWEYDIFTPTVMMDDERDVDALEYQETLSSFISDARKCFKLFRSLVKILDTTSPQSQVLAELLRVAMSLTPESTMAWLQRACETYDVPVEDLRAALRDNS
ncbi:hypothetical protein [Methanothermobacter sp. K4]|uniref:hypothetical protein n=1 Tax=Methanothermobacter sp. K4 TaxID=2913262 RepID=UPI001EDA9E71|nr:hypothetical protein [Methanothermobacter sp. K4]MCG2828506.1 hypothetical protein [Methanothermobacter sp. K4]